MQDVERNCHYFDWVDPELPSQWYKDLLLDLHNNRDVGFNDGFEEFVEVPAQQVLAANKGVGGFESPTKWKLGFWVCVMIIVGLLCK